MRAQRNEDNPAPGGMLGGFVAVAVSATVMLLMLRTTDVGQVIAAIAIGSMLGALAAGQLCPQTPVAMILLAPLTVSVGAYATIAFSYSDHPAVLRAAWHTLNATPGANFDHLLGLGLALPIQYDRQGGCQGGGLPDPPAHQSGGGADTVANINMYVALPHHQKGTHMSRFLEVLNEHSCQPLTPDDIPGSPRRSAKRLNARKPTSRPRSPTSSRSTRR
jgi:hypothetical protein